MSGFMGEVVGTMILILLGDGVVANVVLSKNNRLGQRRAYQSGSDDWSDSYWSLPGSPGGALHYRSIHRRLHRRSAGLAGLCQTL